MRKSGYHQQKDFVRLKKSFSWARGRPILSLALLIVIFVGSLVIWKGKGAWDGKSRFTVVTTSPVSIVSYNPQDNSLWQIPVPDSLKVSADGGYGEYMVGKLMALDGQEKKKGQLFLHSVESHFGLPVTDIVGVKEDAFGNGFWFSGRLATFFQVLVGKISFYNGFWDSLVWAWRVGQIPGVDVHTVDLSESGLVTAETEADGSVVLNLSQERWDLWVRKNLFDPVVDAEGVTLAIVNTTDHNGLGSKVSRIVENLGTRVVQVKSGGEKVERCSLGGGEEFRQKETVKLLMGLFGCEWKVQETTTDRADVLMSLGEGMWSELLAY